MDRIIAKILKVFRGALLVSAFGVTLGTVFLLGYVRGYGVGWNSAVSEAEKLLTDKVSSTTSPQSTEKTGALPSQKPVPKQTSWGGPQLWEAVNKRRLEHGVNALQVKDEICTISSIRLNQLLELGRLDGHEGFSNMPGSRPDLKWIFEKYNLSEFLVSGATSAQNAVDLWENTLGHKELMTGGQYVWGCIYAQNGFGVAIAAY